MTLQRTRLFRLTMAAWLSSAALTLSFDGERVPPQRPRDASSATLFTHSSNCLACHNNLTTESGEDVSIGAMWRGTMMANSARDPYVHASIRRETVDHPSRSAEIQDECAACHMPMLQRVARGQGRTAAVFEHLLACATEPTAMLASDGISCTVCHQIADDALGTPATYNGNFVMPATPPDGVRKIYGAHQIDAGRRTIMRSVTGFIQEEAPHIKESALCATCHTLITKAYGADGAVVGELPEQMTFQEWQHSAFDEQEQRSCQSCHMPAATGPVRIASVLGDARDTLARHTFVGGNAHMLRLLNRYRSELGVVALPGELEAAAHATIRQLQTDTATLTVSAPRREGDTLSFDVEVRNLTGHKFPTGFPSRRAWLQVSVTDERGKTLFESGAIDEHGLIRGNDSDANPGTFEPHYERLTSGDQVQIYESILGDRLGAATTGLLTATRYLKDNRLLPRGFDKATAQPSIGVEGTAAADRDFVGGGDRVRYDVALDRGITAVRVNVELRYQAIGFRWAHNLGGYDAPEPARFVSYYKATARGSSVVVASASINP